MNFLVTVVIPVFNAEKFLELVSIYNSKPDSFFEEKDNNYHEYEEANKTKIIADLILSEINE